MGVPPTLIWRGGRSAFVSAGLVGCGRSPGAIAGRVANVHLKDMRGGKEYDVILQADRGNRRSESDLNNLYGLIHDGRTQHMINWWNGLYRVIAQANLVIEKVPGITPMDEEQKKIFKTHEALEVKDVVRELKEIVGVD